MIVVLPAQAAERGIDSRVTWPESYSVQRDDRSGRLILETPYYRIEHDLRHGGAIARIHLTHGKADNLLLRPVLTRMVDERGQVFTDTDDSRAQVSHRTDQLTEVVTVQARLTDSEGRTAPVRVTTQFEYHWGYIKIHKEFEGDPVRVRELCPFSAVVVPSLTDYGYREGITEEEGGQPFPFGSNRWGKLRASSDQPVRVNFMPRSLLLADPGVEGLEWFAGSDLAQWDLQLTKRRGQGQFALARSATPAGVAVTIAPFSNPTNTIALPKTCAFDFYLGLPILPGHALRPWLHTSFNRNRGEWVTTDQVQRWAEQGIQTIHCHNDGDYYDDGLFWRDGSYPPYPDMDRYDKVIADAQRAGIRVATYFSNKELHPSTREFQEHGAEWARTDLKGRIQHNFFRGTNEFGAQMCLRSGWLDYLKLSIDRVLKNHPLDGVYYDWNVALYCCNAAHEGKEAGQVAAGHWDIDELLNLMEWTRRRVGPNGLVIVHNTTTPMFTMENFADDIVANEWGYGAWKDPGPALQDLPLEWSLVNARARGVISYGQLDAQSPRRLHRLFALEALLSGVTPWPASPETFELYSALKPLGEIERWPFSDWRNDAVALEGGRCASAVYSRPGEAFVLVGNLDKTAGEIRCAVKPDRLRHPLQALASARLTRASGGGASELNVAELVSRGVVLNVPADATVLLQLRPK